MDDDRLYLVSKDEHGYLAITKTYKSAIYFLLDNKWIGNYYHYYNDITGEELYLKDYALSLGYQDIEDFLLCSEDKFNEIFADTFHIQILNQTSTDTWRIY